MIKVSLLYGNDMELLMKFYTIDYSHYHNLISQIKQIEAADWVKDYV